MTNPSSSFQAILDAVETLIHEKGCRQMTMQDIIQRTGLSKGAIYHYVTGKDELLGLVMKSRIEIANERFSQAVNHPQSYGLQKPLQSIAEGMIRATSYANVTNKIFIYLLGQMDQPKVAEIVRDVYEFTLQTCSAWIEVGKKAGFIPAEADSNKLADSLLTYMYGLRVQSTVMQQDSQVTVEELIRFMTRALS
ncbi:TetR/AcrR family transcriptional regulator [Paenibacillus cremeus]|uniref:TetR/AcrR family transcriptional regulator n=1 Tax=Paenibacillus cremeus TaxID=2163881 RepID=A0A559KFK5_9BACL|nr:TetR/AcrR family transcriptional regulator [Paenibacillus cremeus]TVY10912.1 TetR/AcrR family transcriptional regulator [Paenibacillus cremeus]